MKARLDAGSTMLVIALVIGAATRLWHLADGSIQVDEAHTFAVASKPWAEMLATIVKSDYHPPLFYAITHVLLGLGWLPVTLRYLTAPFALVTIAATWGIGRRLFGPIAAGIAAIVLAIDPSAILWDRIYRMYVVFDALVALSWWIMIEAIDARGPRRAWLWVAFAACAIVQPYTHYLGLLNLGCQALYALTRSRTAWPAMAAAAASVVCFIPWLPALRVQYPGGGLVAGTAALPIQWLTLARDAVIAGSPLAWIQAPGFDLIATLVCVGLSVWAAASAPRSILPFWLLMAAAQIALSIASGKFLAAPRYLLPVLPVLVLGIGALTHRLLETRLRVVGTVMSLCIVALFGYCSTNVLFDPLYQFPDWTIVHNIVEQHEQPMDAVVFDQGYTSEVFTNDPALQSHDVAAPSSSDELPRLLEWLHTHSRERIWYVENQYYYVDPDRRLIATLEASRPRVNEWLEPRVELSNRVYVVLFGPERTKANHTHDEGR